MVITISVLVLMAEICTFVTKSIKDDSKGSYY